MSLMDNVLQYDSEESEPQGFYTFKPVQIIQKKKIGLLDKQLSLVKANYSEQKIQEIADEVDMAPIQDVFKKQTAINQEDFITKPLELDFDPFAGSLNKQQQEDELFNRAEEEKAEEAQRRRQTKQKADHGKLRPRVTEGAFDKLQISKHGQLQAFSDDEYRQYIERMGGKPTLNFSQRCQILIVNQNTSQQFIVQAQRNLARVVDEDQFYKLVVQKSVKALQKEYLLQKQQFLHIRNESDIEQFVNNLNWVECDQCFHYINLKEIDQLCKLQYGEKQNKQLEQPMLLDQIEVIKEGINEVQDGKEVQLLQKQEQKACALKERSNNNADLTEQPIKVPTIQAQPIKKIQLQNSQKKQKSYLQKYEPQTFFEVQNQTLSTILQKLRENKEIVLVTGPTGCGKTTLIKLIINELKYELFTSDNCSQLIQMIKSKSLNLQNNDKIKCILVDDIENIDQLNILTQQFQNRSNNRIICATSDYYNPKFKSYKKCFVEVKLKQQNIKQILENIYTEEKRSQQHIAKLPVQHIQQILEEISIKCQNDLRQSIIQLEYALNCQNNYIKCNIQQIIQQPNYFQLTDNIFQQKQLKQNIEQYYQDPLLVHQYLLQNYQQKGSYQTRYLSYVSELLSVADLAIGKMYKQGDWSGYNTACINETSQISMVSKMSSVQQQITFPLQMFQLKTKQAPPFIYAQEGLLSSFENQQSVQIGFRILDASFYLGFDFNNQQERSLDMGINESFRDVVAFYGLKFCTDKRKTELEQWVMQGAELQNLGGDKSKKQKK